MAGSYKISEGLSPRGKQYILKSPSGMRHAFSTRAEAEKAANAAVLAHFPEGVSIAEQFRQEQEANRFIAHRAQVAKLNAAAAASQEHNNKHVGATAPSMTGGEGGNPYHDEAGKFTTKAGAKHYG